jgi:UDP-N-acetylglucosamine acyltransferase
LRRRGFSAEKIAEIQNIYRILFVKGLSNTHALEELSTQVAPSEERDLVLDFVKSSARGIMKGYHRDED